MDATEAVIVGDSIWDMLEPGGHARLASAFSQAVMDRMSWKRREHTESMKTRRVFFFTWTRSASEAHSDEITPKFITRFFESRSSGSLRAQSLG